jgi:hypothetical protein
VGAKTPTRCIFIAQDSDPHVQAKIAEVKEKVNMLERTLEQDISHKDSIQRSSKSPPAYEAPVLPGQDLDHSDQEDDDDLKDVGPSHFGVHDITYHEDQDNDDDIVDLGISIGRLRITERIGGLVRPKYHEEVCRGPTNS